MGSNIFLCVLLLAATSNLSSLADFSLTCSLPAPTCPACTVVNCECEGADLEGSLTWNISSTESGPCEILYAFLNSAGTIRGDCDTITTNASSVIRNNMLSLFNSSLSVTLMEDTTTVSCKNITGHSIQHILHFQVSTNYLEHGNKCFNIMDTRKARSSAQGCIQ